MSEPADKPGVIEFPSRAVLAARLADLIAARLEAGAAADGRGELAVSGGSTPKPLYEALAQRGLDWSKMRATLVDERWVGPDHPRSNEAFIRDAFAAAPALEIVGLYNGAASPAAGLDDVAARLAERKKPFDVVVLGMGNDGHTASWFPHATGLEEALSGEADFCAVTAERSDVTGDEVERMTLTLSAVRRAGLVCLMITGDDKRATFEKALEAGPIEEMPVRALLAARPDLWVAWAR